MLLGGHLEGEPQEAPGDVLALQALAMAAQAQGAPANRHQDRIVEMRWTAVRRQYHLT